MAKKIKVKKVKKAGKGFKLPIAEKKEKVIAKKAKPAKKEKEEKNLSAVQQFFNWTLQAFPDEAQFIFKIGGKDSNMIFFGKPHQKFMPQGAYVFCGLFMIFDKPNEQNQAFAAKLIGHEYKCHIVDNLTEAVNIFVQYVCLNDYKKPNPYQPQQPMTASVAPQHSQVPPELLEAIAAAQKTKQAEQAANAEAPAADLPLLN